MKEQTNSNTREKSSPGLPDWMVFPTIAELFDPTPLEAIAHMRAKQAEYEARSATGSTADRVRDRMIAESYAHTCTLLQNLEERRQILLADEATVTAKKR